MNNQLKIQAIRLNKNPIIDQSLRGLEEETGANINGSYLICVPD